MAGQPKRRAAQQSIEATGPERILEQVAAGRTLTAIASDIGVSRPTLNAWLLEPAQRDSYARAQRFAASALVEQSLAIVDDAEPQTVQVAKLQADTRRWIAGKLDREAWGDTPGASVQITINNSHLDALRNRVVNPED